MSIEAIAVFNENIPSKTKVYGTIVFRESSKTNNVIVDINLGGLKPGKHGIHIHETGNLLDKCMECKSHFNPFDEVHGGRNSIHRHVGDLGNITANNNGMVSTTFSDNLISLRDIKRNIIGRSVVIHSDEDDLGKGGNEESLKTGNAGKRVACSVIGYKNIVYFK